MNLDIKLLHNRIKRTIDIGTDSGVSIIINSSDDYKFYNRQKIINKFL